MYMCMFSIMYVYMYIKEMHRHIYTRSFDLSLLSPPSLPPSLPVSLHRLIHTETRQAISKLLQATSEPKSADVRRVSQKVVTALFDLNPATFSLMLRSVSKALQEAANRILKVYMQVSVVFLSLSLTTPPSCRKHLLVQMMSHQVLPANGQVARLSGTAESLPVPLHLLRYPDHVLNSVMS